MKLSEAKEKYVQTWGILGSNWGINRTMAQVHALLLVSTEPLSTDDIMDALVISRGNANMNIRELINMGIVRKEIVKGERKEYFVAEKDIWFLFKQIVKERKAKEIDPLIAHISELKQVDEQTVEAKEFKKLVTDLLSVTNKLNNILELAIKSDEHWLVGKITNLIK